MEYLKKFFFLIDRNKIILIGFFLLFFFSSIFEVLGISLLGGFLAYLTNFQISESTALGKVFYFLNSLGVETSSINSLASFIVIILTARFFFQLIANYLILDFTTNTTNNLRKKLISTYLNLKYLDFINKDSSSSYNELTILTDQFSNLLHVGLKLISDLILLLLIIIMLYLVNDVIFFALFFIFLFLFLINKFVFSKKISKLGVKANDLSEKIFKNFKDGLTGFKQIKVLNKTKFIIENISSSLKKHAKLLINYNFLLVVIRYLIEYFIAIILIFTAILIYSLNDESYALVVVTIFGVSALRSLPLITNLINSMNVLFYSKNAIDRLYKSINLIKNSTLPINKREIIKDFKFNSLKVNDISFGYNNFNILKNINLQINEKDLIFITGPSGCGKTTLLDIICGLIEPSKGSIIVNNQSSSQIINSFADKIYYLSQKSFILNDTLEHNIAFADNEISKHKLNIAIKMAGLEKFSQKIKDSLNRSLGEDASKISGGEMQRIAIARALYSEKEVLILDEFTSSLDNENENKIFETISELNKTKTIIIVSHNLEISKFVKKAYKIEKGELIKIK